MEQNTGATTLDILFEDPTVRIYLLGSVEQAEAQTGDPDIQIGLWFIQDSPNYMIVPVSPVNPEERWFYNKWEPIDDRGCDVRLEDVVDRYPAIANFRPIWDHLEDDLCLISFTDDRAFDYRLNRNLEKTRMGGMDESELQEHIAIRGGRRAFLDAIPDDASTAALKDLKSYFDGINDYNGFDDIIADLADMAGDIESVIELVEMDLPQFNYVKRELLADNATAIPIAEAAVRAARYIDKHQFRSGKFEDWDNNVTDMMMEIMAHKEMTTEARTIIMRAIRTGVYDIA